MITVNLLPLRPLLFVAAIVLPQLSWAQQPQTMTRSEAVAAGLISAVDVAPGDDTLIVITPAANTPALGERSSPRTRPTTPAVGGDAGSGNAGAGSSAATGGSAGTAGGSVQGGSASPVQFTGNGQVGTSQGQSSNSQGQSAGNSQGGTSQGQSGTSQGQGDVSQGQGGNAQGGGGGFRSGSGQGGSGFQGRRGQGGATGAMQQAADGQGAAGEAGSGSAGGGRRGAPAADENTVQALIMRDQGLPEVLNYLELLTKKAILRSQTLPALKLNFDSVGPMSREEAVIAIESLLALNGIAVTPMGERFLKATPINEVAKQVPQFLSGSALGLMPSQQFYTKYFKLEYLDALNEGQPIVQGLLSLAAKQEGNPVIFPKSNSIMVTDMLINLQRIEEVLARSDKPHTGVTGLTFFQLKHVKAEELKRRLTTLVANKDSSIGAAFSHNTTFESDERTNQLIVATHESNLPLLRQLIEGLDSDVEPQTTSEVYYIKHAEADNIQTLLNSVITGQQQARDQANTAQNTGIAGGAAGGASGAEAAAVLANVQAGVTAALNEAKTLHFSNYVTVVADERANAIVAYGTRTDLAQISKLIDKIDILLAQVNIQVIIAEVTLADGVATGIEQLNIGYDTSGLTSSGGLGGWSAGTSGTSYTGGDSPFGFTGTLDPKRFSLVINNAKTNRNFRMLASPLIVTTHNQEGQVDITEKRPIITGTSTQLLDNPVTSNTVSYENIGIKLRVTPKIGNNGIIQMEIEQEVENITSFVPVNGNDQPVIATRMAKSYVSVRSGEVVVLAGLQETTLSENDNKLWLIGEIPLIGDLLNGSGRKVERRELMIFVQPFVMTTDTEIATMTNQAIDNLDNAGDVRTFLQTRNASDVTTEQTRASDEVPDEERRPVTSPRRGKR